jgi:hypothetical protein
VAKRPGVRATSHPLAMGGHHAVCIVAGGALLVQAVASARCVCVIVVAQVRNTLSSFSLRANCTPTLLDNTSAASSTMQRCYEKMIRCCAASEKSMATLLTICVTQRMHRPQLASPRSVTLHAAGLHLKSSNNIEPLIVTHHKRKSITRPARRQVWPLHRVSLRR